MSSESVVGTSETSKLERKVETKPNAVVDATSVWDAIQTLYLHANFVGRVVNEPGVEAKLIIIIKKLKTWTAEMSDVAELQRRQSNNLADIESLLLHPRFAQRVPPRQRHSSIYFR